MCLIVRLSINGSRHSDTRDKGYSDNMLNAVFIVMLSVVVLSVNTLSVVVLMSVMLGFVILIL
jgi:hypothetical protein